MTEQSPIFSIIVPAHNEQNHIGACLESIEEAGRLVPCDYEIIVVLNRCTDGTEQIARDRGARIVTEPARNLSCIRNAGGAVARGEIIVTIDADSSMSPDMLAEIKRLLGLGRYIGGGVLVKMERLSPGIICTLLMIIPYILFLGVSGGLFWCLRKDFEAIGGFDENLVSAEDLDFARRLKAHGKSVGKRFKTILKAHIVTSARKFDMFGDWYLVRRPRLVWAILRGKNVEAAESFFYNVKR